MADVVRFGGSTSDHPFGTVEVAGKVFALAAELVSVEGGTIVSTLTFSGFDVENECPTCRRFDTKPRQVVAGTMGEAIEEAIRRGFFVEIEQSGGR